MNEQSNILDKSFSKAEQEQYAFGPWLVEITETDLIPPQYINYKEEILQSVFSFKVPVNKDRQQLKPGMLMYKNVVIMHNDFIKILSIMDNGSLEDIIHEVQLPYKDIAYVIRGGELLSNYIIIGVENHEYKIEYYTVSEIITTKILSMIRTRSLTDDSLREIIEYEKEALRKKPLFSYFSKKDRLTDVMKVLAYQCEDKVKFVGHSFLEKIVSTFKVKKLDEIIYLSNGKELIIVSGDIENKKESTVDYSYRHCYIRLEKISSIAIYPDEKAFDSQLLTVTIDKADVVFHIKTNFEQGKLMELV